MINSDLMLWDLQVLISELTENKTIWMNKPEF